jgi:hypothetical protein
MKIPFFSLLLTLLIVFSTCEICRAQRATNARNAPREPDPMHDWITIPVKQTIYPPKARPMEFNSTLPWPTDLRPAAPPTPASTKDQVISLPDSNYKINDPGIIMGPLESGLVVVAGGVDTFFSKRDNELNKSVLSLASFKHGKAITRIFPSEMKAHNISPNGKFLAVSVKPKSGNWRKMNHLLILRLDDGTFSPVAHYTPFDDAPSVRQRNDTMGIYDVLWLNNQQLFVVSDNEMGVQLDLTTHTIGFGMYPEKPCFRSPYLLTPDRKYLLAVHHTWENHNNDSDVKGVAIYNTEDGKQLGYLKLSQDQKDKSPSAALHRILDLSSNGRMMAGRGESDWLYVWDLFRGQVIGNYPQPVGEHGIWINNRFIFGSAFGAPYLWDAKDKVICAKYENKAELCDFVALGDKLLYLAADDSFRPAENRLICSSVIPANIQEFLQEAARRTERIMGPGDDVSLEFNLRHGSAFQNQIEQHLWKVCKTNGWNIVAPGDSEFRIEAYMTDLENEIEYQLKAPRAMPFEPPLATQNFRPYTIGYSIYQGKRLIWYHSSRVFPRSVYESVEEFKRLLPEEMRAKPDWFLGISFPETITRGDMESEKRNATITFNGIEFN